MSRSLHDMDEQELGALIEKLSETVQRLAHEKPDSDDHRREVGLLSDVRQLLAAKRRLKT
jgi:hypothetical protein